MNSLEAAFLANVQNGQKKCANQVAFTSSSVVAAAAIVRFDTQAEQRVADGLCHPFVRTAHRLCYIPNKGQKSGSKLAEVREKKG